MLGIEIEFGNHWTQPETPCYKPTKAKTPARRGFYSFSGGPGRNLLGPENARSLLKPSEGQHCMGDDSFGVKDSTKLYSVIEQPLVDLVGKAF